MRYTLKQLPFSEKEILVRLEFEELIPYIEEKAKKRGKEIEVKGFRKGKVPQKLVEFLLEDKILEEVAQEAIQKSYLEIIKELNQEVLGPPKIEILKLASGNPLEFKITICTLPQVQLPNYKEIASTVKRREVEVKEKEIEETLKWLQKSRAKRIAKKEPARLGDFVEIKWSSPQIEETKEHTERVILGESHLLPQFEKEIIGMRAGEEKEFSINFPPNYFNQSLANKEALIKMKILKVEKVELPEINDQWAKTLGKFNNLEELKQSIREGILMEKEKIESQRIQAEILEKIAKETSLEVPKVLVEIELQRTLEELKQNIPQLLGISFDQYLKQTNQNQEELKKSLIPEITLKVKKFLILRAIKKEENIQASEAEIKEEADKFLQQFRTPKEAQEHIDPENLREYIRERIENQKTLQFLESFAQKINN